jgi:hypothetical protein
MPATLPTVAAAAAAVVRVSLTLGHRAEAMTFVGALASRVAAEDAAPLRLAAVVCGSNGCALVRTSRARPHRPRS